MNPAVRRFAYRLAALATLLLSTGCAGARHWSETGEAGVTLYLEGPERGRKVQVATSLDGYRPIDLLAGASGRWLVRLPASAPFRYFFLVDGRAITVACPMREFDDFGGQTCLYQPQSQERDH